MNKSPPTPYSKSTMSNQTPTIPPALDDYLKIIHKPDASFTLQRLDPRTPPASDPTLPISVLTKDVTINESTNTWARLFLPRISLLSSSNPNNKKLRLPLIVFFHGSGFIMMSAASTVYHDFCVEMADNIGAMVVSVGYRLAPEHRLPAAFEDAVDALHWIRSSQEEWVKHYADYCNCYLMGNSAGATIAYHTGLRVAEDVDHLKPLRTQGLILRQPFFGGIKRTNSELRLENDDPVIPLCATDLMWELALPLGANRDHEYCNLRVGYGPKKLDKMKELGWRVLVSWTGGDQLADRGKEVVQLLEEKGVQVVSDFEEEGCQEVEYNEPLKSKKLIGLVKGFIST